ncbi:transcriptional regulator [Haloferax mucosum ATCC BAA-1512]|uniref:Transcriptional regulator n=1 Tax=Haloferax mucosum ATCC BAA-1512 TaxID=662479 RepID=M0IJM2_9EURY|nr:transcriptional regulator [Haloferax mucosum ATCC BAA-1512]
MSKDKDSPDKPTGTNRSTAQNVYTTDLTAFQWDILVTLSREPMYGLAIKRHLEAYYNSDVNHGRLYPNLDTLVERNLITKSELDKRTNQYELTTTGVATVRDRFDWMLSKFVTDDERAEKITDLVEQNNAVRTPATDGDNDEVR